MKKRPALRPDRLICFLGIVAAAYFCAYFVILSLPSGVRLPAAALPYPIEGELKYLDINGSWEVFPDYHGLPSALFAPIHWLDRTYWRPGKWHGNDPNARQREMDFSWLQPSPSPTP